MVEARPDVLGALQLDLAAGMDAVRFAQRLGIQPDPWQSDLLTSPSRQVLVNCSRQAGKSTAAGLVSLHRALYVPRSLVLILAPSERQAKETFKNAADHYRNMGHEVAAESERKMGMELWNGSRIEALPGSEKTIRGFAAVDLLILDEAARIDDALYYAVRPMLAVSGGRLVLMSTPYGRRGVFFDAWQNGGDEWERFEVPATEIGRISPAFLEHERRTLPERMFRQEFMCEFLEVDDAVFTYDMVQSAVSEEVAPLRFGGDEW